VSDKSAFINPRDSSVRRLMNESVFWQSHNEKYLPQEMMHRDMSLHFMDDFFSSFAFARAGVGIPLGELEVVSSDIDI
jgi:hypothetical protein